MEFAAEITRIATGSEAEAIQAEMLSAARMIQKAFGRNKVPQRSEVGIVAPEQGFPGFLIANILEWQAQVRSADILKGLQPRSGGHG